MTDSSDDADGRCLLLELSDDELGVIFEGLADPLAPGVAVAMSSTCKGVRTPLRAALDVLKQRYKAAVALSRKMGMMGATCQSTLRAQGTLKMGELQIMGAESKGLTAGDMAVLSMIMRTNRGLPMLHSLWLYTNGFGDEGLQSLCEGLAVTSSLEVLSLTENKIGPAGAEALAAALRVLPKLKHLALGNNAIGNQGAAALAQPLRKLPALQKLDLQMCGIDDEGMASLITGVTKDDFKECIMLDLRSNKLTGASFAALAAALDGGAFPNILQLRLDMNLASDAAHHKLRMAIRRVQERRQDED